MISDVFNEEQRDALQEVVNIGMGTAGATLGSVLESLVGLSIPKIDLVRLEQLADLPSAVGWTDDDACVIRQAFYDHLDGEVIVLFGRQGQAHLSKKLGYGDETDEATDQELLLDFTNVFVGACMNGIGRQLGLDLSFSPPSILSITSPISTTLQNLDVSVDTLLLINVDFVLHECSFRSRLVILLPHHSTLVLKQAVERFVESLV